MYDPYPVSRATNGPIQSVRRVTAYAQYPYPADRQHSRNGGQPRGSFALPEKAKRTARSAAESAAAWLNQTRGLRAALSALTSPQTTAFEERSVVSDQSFAVTGAASRGADRADCTVSILGLAAGQTNVSYELSASAPSVVGAGRHSFALMADGIREIVSVTVAAGDSNSAMLSKLADAINRSKAGVSAKIGNNPEAGTQQMTIASDKTGADRSFALSDTAGFIIAATGAGMQVAEAGDAVYRIDGGPVHRSPVNEIVLQDGRVSLRLHALTQAAEVSVVDDGHAVASQLVSVIEQVNELNETFANASAYLDESLKEVVDASLSGPSAKWLGFSLSPDGLWRLDENKLLAELSERPEHVRRLTMGASGIAAGLSEALTRIERMPAESMLSTAADGFQSYMAYQASQLPYLQLQLNGVLLDSAQ